MNRFFSKQKPKDSADDFQNGTKKPKKGKKGQPEPKPELDLHTLLPTDDNFRTSLIMPNLSARFSMLREQDDPSSKLGKASDDSVLSSKRQSRLHDFGFKSSTLADIDEVSSINGSIQPPFLRERNGSMESFRTGYEDSETGGSVMTRARPGEGNILFGGRQKVYKITGSGGYRGRALYEDDVSMSSFQRLRKEEKERQLAEMREQTNASPSREDSMSSMSGYNQRRETSSSTNSGPPNPRSSTAATSINSQATNSPTVQGQTGLERSVTKTRRLYEQGLDQHMQDQQASQLHRLNTVHRHRGESGSGKSSPTALSQTRSASGLSDRFQRNYDSSRTASPVPTTSNNNLSSASNLTASATSSPVLGHSNSPPISPVRSDLEELTNALNPNDRGKATALGAFNKPKPFSEEQYLQRQMHLQQGRDTPSSGRDDDHNRDSHSSQAESESTHASAEGTVPTAFSVFQKAASQIKQTGAPSAQLQSSSSGQRTFFASPSESEIDFDGASTEPPAVDVQQRTQGARRPSPSPNRAAPPMHEHPALRSQQYEKEFDHTRNPLPQTSITRSSVSEKDSDMDSPTLGGTTGGLSGLIHQHLRTASNVSSNYSDGPDDNYNREPYTQHNYLRSEPDTPAHSSYGQSNPWDAEDRTENDSRSSVSPDDAQPAKAPVSNRKLTLDEMGARAFEIQQDAEARRAAWEMEMLRKHSRQPSAEERDAFQQELAIRQKAIADRLRQQIDEDNYSGSGSGSGARKALGMLRSKSSKDSMASGTRHDPPPSKLKMLGFGGSSTSINKMNRDHWRYDDDRPSVRSRESSSHSRPRFGAREHDTHSYMDASRDDSREFSRTTLDRSPPTSHPSSVRNRSSSDISSGQSRNRAGEYRNGTDNSQMEETESSSTTPEARPELFLSDRSRSNSKSTATSQYSEKSLYPQESMQRGPSPGPSPGFGFPSSIPTPRPSPGPGSAPNVSGLQRPIQTGYAVSVTPPLSAVNTPTGGAFNTNRAPPRRRTVNKQDISEPILVSSTSKQDTVDLPPGASLKNGADVVPPLPAMNPRRRFGFGRSNPSSPNTGSPAATPTSEEAPPFLEARAYSGEDAEKLRRQRKNLRKTSSEGHSLHERI